jgi:hypothetical protein
MALGDYITFTRKSDGTRFDSLMTYGLILASQSEDSPEPVTHTVEVPGRSGYIDLTESLTGDVIYSGYDSKYKFISVSQNDRKEYYERLATTIKNDLHGRKVEYVKSWESGYTYTARVSVSYSFDRYRLDVTIGLENEPYKSKGKQVYALNATGGKMYRLESGRKPVRPYLECSQPCIINWQGAESVIGAGSWRLNDVLFTQGWNEIYLNSFRFWNIKWEDVSADGKHTLAWDEASGKRWDDLQRLGGDFQDVPQEWGDLRYTTWEEVVQKKWTDVDFRNEAVPATIVYLTYDWEDL